MKKLNILRHIIDALWIVSMVFVPILLFYMIAIFFTDDFNIGFKINENKTETFNLLEKIILAINMAVYLWYIYALFLFKKIIREFIKTNIFGDKIIKLLNKIGVILTFGTLILIVSNFVFEIYEKGMFQIGISLSGNIITLCLGLFFMVLSEIFTISNQLKQENDLTI